jgi:hypothetical protein
MIMSLHTLAQKHAASNLGASEKFRFENLVPTKSIDAASFMNTKPQGSDSLNLRALNLAPRDAAKKSLAVADNSLSTVGPSKRVGNAFGEADLFKSKSGVRSGFERHRNANLTSLTLTLSESRNLAEPK